MPTAKRRVAARLRVPRKIACAAALLVAASCSGGGGDTAAPPETACERAARERTNLGCEFFAVDLDNGYTPPTELSAALQFGVVVVNPSSSAAEVTVERSDAAPGGTPDPVVVATASVAPGAFARLDLPAREVDGTEFTPTFSEGPGTFLSAHAYRIRASAPVAAYQFNPVVQDYSNGATMLLPTSALTGRYVALSWPAANPIDPIGLVGLPDHSFVAVVGVTDAPVEVTVTLGGDVAAGGGVPATSAGGSVALTLRAFEVLNLESAGLTADLTGTEIVASGPVAVFAGAERAVVPMAVMPPPPTPDYSDAPCCSDHLEQQMFPLSTLGKTFVATRSPPRSSAAVPEADVWRALATEDGTAIATGLPPPNDAFSLGAGEFVEFWATTSFVLSASKPVVLGQYLVGGGYVAAPTVSGDPDFVLVAPVEQLRPSAAFAVLPGFVNACVVAAPAAAQVMLDSTRISGATAAGCARSDVGTAGGEEWVAYLCELADGVHRVDADRSVNVVVYGYSNLSSYAYPAGAGLAPLR